MGGRDAFGREEGEDALAAMGWQLTGGAALPGSPPVATERHVVALTPPKASPPPRSPAAAQPWPAPVVTAEQPVPALPAAPRARRRPRTVSRLIGPLVLLALLLVVIGSDRFDGIVDAVRDAIQSAPPAGLESGSLLRPAELGEALDKLPAGDIKLLRVAPERLNATVVVDGKVHVVQVTAEGEETDVATPARGGGRSLRPDPDAPNRIVRTAARRSGRDPTQVSYLVLRASGRKAEWQLFFRDGLRYSASANGRKVRRAG